MPIVRHRRHGAEPPGAAGLTRTAIAVAPQLRVWADALRARLQQRRYLVTVGTQAGSDIALVPSGSPQAVQEVRGREPSIGLLAVNDRPGHRDPAEVAALLEAGADSYWAATTLTSSAPWSRPSPAASLGLPVDQDSSSRPTTGV